MRALVLAAGRGSRLGPFTADRPKCLVEIDGKPLLHRQVAALRAAGAREIGVVTGWCSEAFATSTLEMFENPRWAETTMVESLAAAEQWLLAGPVLVSYGDIVYSAATARRLAEASGPLAIAYDPDWEALWCSRFEQPLDDAETFVRDLSGDLVDIGGQPSTAEEVQGQYLGLLRFTPEAWSAMRELRASDAEARALDMTGLLRQLVRADRLAIRTVACDGPWCEFDDPSDLDVGLGIVRELDESLPS